MAFSGTIFDYNGVLIDDEAVHLAAFRAVLEPRGVSVDEAAYWDRYIGYDDVGGFRAMLQDAGRDAPNQLVAELVREKVPEYLRRAEGHLRPFPGAADVVRARAAVGPVAVVSGALLAEIELGLKLLGVRELVADVVAAEDTNASKPDPEGYQLGKSRLAARGAAGRMVVVEDTVAGVRAAKAAGLCCVAVEHSTRREALEEAGADAVVPVIADVDAALLERLAAGT